MSLEKEINNNSQKHFMILGHPRSGTNFISTILRSHPEISLLIEPFSMHNRYTQEQFFRYWGDDSYKTDVYHKGLGSFPKSVEFFADFRKWFESKEDELHGFKETTFLMKLQWLHEYLPEANVIYIERDPRGIVSSFKKGGLFERWNYQNLFYGLAEDVKGNPQLHQYAELVEETDQSNWVDVLTTMYIIATQEAKRNLPSFRHTQWKYERVVASPESSFSEILAFLGLQMDKEVEKEIGLRCSETRGGTFSTYRNSREISQQYRYILSPNEMKLIDMKMQRQGI